jgi:L-lactate utilization protein LutC
VNDRDLILSALPDGAGVPPTNTPEFVPIAGDLVGAFKASLEALGGKLLDAEGLKELAAKKKWVDQDADPKLRTDAESIWDAEVGFSRAICAVAGTGSLMFASGSNSQRLTTLVPPVSVVFLKKADIVASLSEALEKAGHYADRNVVLVTGPSRTADIEGILVRGIHGPGELYVSFCDE